jgi:hypothetical protein
MKDDVGMADRRLDLGFGCRRHKNRIHRRKHAVYRFVEVLKKEEN